MNYRCQIAGGKATVWGKATRRPAFTFTELLIVIAIIGLLATLTTGAAVKIISTQRQNNTRLTVKKVAAMVERRWKRVIDDANKETIPSNFLNTWAGGDSDRARVMWIKFRLKQEFPMNFSEILFPDPNNPQYFQPLQVYQDQLNRAGVVPNPANPPKATESAACLLMALTTKGRSGVSLDADTFTANEVADTDNDGVKELVDGWRQPLAFCRWPTGNTDVASLYKGPASSVLRDPGDPLGRLMDPAWNTSTNQYAQLFQQLLHSITSGGAPNSYYTVPVVVSAGPDGKMGYATISSAYQPDPMTADSTGNRYDNITSYQP